MSLIKVGEISSFPNGEMREVEIFGDRKVLISNTGDQLYATGHKCSHLGAPLVKGYFDGETVRCPWHGACFNVKTGDIEDFPGCKSLSTFEVVVEDESVSIRIEEDFVDTVERPTVGSSVEDDRVFVIVGGGSAGGIAAVTLREEGYTGTILVVSKENHLPYNRPVLSKNLAANASDILLRSEEYYNSLDIQFLLGVEVTELNPETKTIKTTAGDDIVYTKCLVATGGSSQLLKFIPGSDGSNIYPLRTIEEANLIHSVVQGKKVLLVGSSFIGMEVAASIHEIAETVTVIGMENVPFERVLGNEIGEILQGFHESKGIQFVLNAVAQEFKQQDGVVTSVLLKDGREIDCDVIVLGAGVVPETGFITPVDGVIIERDRTILVDEFLNVGVEGLYAAGDIARVPFIIENQTVRIEHYGYAMTQGKLAAFNMVNETNQKRINEHVPFFWTVQYGKSIRYAGHAFSYDEILIEKEGDNLDNTKFSAFYIKDNIALAVCTMNRDPLAAEFAQSFEQKNFWTKEQALERISQHKL